MSTRIAINQWISLDLKEKQYYRMDQSGDTNLAHQTEVNYVTFKLFDDICNVTLKNISITCNNIVVISVISFCFFKYKCILHIFQICGLKIR